MQKVMIAAALAALLASPVPAAGQFGQLDKIGKAAKTAEKRAGQFKDIEMTDAEEQELGAAVSERIRQRYGVVQDPAIHRYVTLVGTVLAQASTRPGLAWRFVVLDTDGVNALAAPGGYIHITRGALSLLRNEAELGGVLAHELIHVTEKHTIRAIQKGKLVQMGADETLKDNEELFGKLVEQAYKVVDSGFGRGDELESDAKGVVLASNVGYAPGGLSGFLTTISARNKDSGEKQGLFASHPEMKERLDKLAATIKSQKLTATATVEARFAKHVTYEPVALAEVATVAAGSAGVAGGGSKPAEKTEAKAEEPKKKKGFGLSSLTGPGGGSEKKSAEVTGSGASRGVDKERTAKGGTNPAAVTVKVTAADITSFKKDGQLN
jgi:predicted Zn-dependent protease